MFVPRKGRSYAHPHPNTQSCRSHTVQSWGHTAFHGRSGLYPAHIAIKIVLRPENVLCTPLQLCAQCDTFAKLQWQVSAICTADHKLQAGRQRVQQLTRHKTRICDKVHNIVNHDLLWHTVFLATIPKASRFSCTAVSITSWSAECR